MKTLKDYDPLWIDKRKAERIRAAEVAALKAAETLIDGPYEAWGPPDEEATTVEFPVVNVSSLREALRNLKAERGE